MVHKLMIYTVVTNGITQNHKTEYQEQMLLLKRDKNMQLYKGYLGLFIASTGLGA